MDDELDVKKSPTPNKGAKSSLSRESSHDKVRKRRTRSRSREPHRRRRSFSKSPVFRGGAFRGTRNNNNRFGRRSPFRGNRNFNNRFNDRRSRSRSRDRYDNFRGRRNRRSKSDSPVRNNSYMQQQISETPQYNYENYSQAQSQFGTMDQMASQFNSYDFQGASTFPLQGSAFNLGISCPPPPGMMSESQFPPAPSMHPEMNKEDRLKREAAVAEEKKRQREGLKKQQEQYVNRSEKMKRELKELKQQKADLAASHGKRSPSPKTNGFIKENEKLQSQISSKLSEILNVIDMLSGIIGKDNDEVSKNKFQKTKKSDSDSSPERIKSELLESMKQKKKEAEQRKEKFNYIVYDPELHWCKPCATFPKTAKDYLAHLHTKEHTEKSVKNPSDAPWREIFQKTNDVASFPDAPTKHAPIRGLQFFEPTSAWFCKLCEVFMGDTWCASLHLKSELHTEKYAKFIEREPKFEDKWMEARKKALELYEHPNGNAQVEPEKKKDEKKSKKKKNKKDGKKDKKKRKVGKKRKRGSSSSSSSGTENSNSSSSSEETPKKSDNEHGDAKNSIRVKMRNLLTKGSVTENNEKSGKWTMVSANSKKPIPPPAPSISSNSQQEKKKDEQIMNQWATVEPIISLEEKRLLESLKGRLKNQQAEPSTKKLSNPTRKDDLKEKNRDRDRSGDRDSSRDRSRERSRGYRGVRAYRGRRSRSRSRSRSRGRASRRYSRSRSGSRNRRRVERPIVRFPAEPRLPPLREEKKLPARSYVMSKKDDTTNNAKKVMPMIGKMPVFKKQMIDKKSEEQAEEKEEEPTAAEVTTEDKKPRDDSWDDYMPDPLQYSALMGAPPPPPPRIEEPEVVPPGLDPEQDSEFIPQPISDAPIARKGPLPKDFQDTLDLLYDGDKLQKKAIFDEPKIVEAPTISNEPPQMVADPDGPQMIMAEDLPQHNFYGGFYGHNSEDSALNDMQTSITIEEQQGESIVQNTDEANNSPVAVTDDVKIESKEQEMEMDDLAMLGIDVNDVGTGMW